MLTCLSVLARDESRNCRRRNGRPKGPHSGAHEDFIGNVGDEDSPSVDLTPLSDLNMRNVFRSNQAEYLKVKRMKLSRKMSKKGQGFE